MANSLPDLIDKIKDQSKNQEELSVEELMHIVGSRSFGSLLLLPSITVASPLGAIPGVPALMSTLILIVAIQIILNKKYVWLPKKIKSVSVKRDKLVKALNKVRPHLKFTDKIFTSRLVFFNKSPFLQITGLICAILAIAMIPIGFIPLAVFIPAIIILFFALALATNDGLITLLAIVATLITAFFTIRSL